MGLPPGRKFPYSAAVHARLVSGVDSSVWTTSGASPGNCRGNSPSRWFRILALSSRYSGGRCPGRVSSQRLKTFLFVKVTSSAVCFSSPDVWSPACYNVGKVT